MASYTTNLDLKKPAKSDKIRIADINGNMDDIDAAFGAIGDTSVATQMSDIRAGMAIVAVSNVHAAIASGEYVYVTGHDTLDDGLYKASSAIAANGTLSSSNLTAVSKGGLNALNDQIANLKFAKMEITMPDSSGNFRYNLPSGYSNLNSIICGASVKTSSGFAYSIASLKTNGYDLVLNNYELVISVDTTHSSGFHSLTCEILLYKYT